MITRFGTSATLGRQGALVSQMVSRLTLGGLFLLSTSSMIASAQSAALSDADSALLMRSTVPLRAAVLPVLDSARVAQLPVEPLIDKALEGQSKGAGPDRIVAAVSSLVALMRDARSALGASASPIELAAGSSALRAGAPLATLTRLRAARPNEPVTVPLGVMSELIARGVAPTTSASVVVALARAGASDASLVALRKQVDLDLASGIAPSISVARRAVQAGASPGAGPGGGGGGGMVPSFVP